MNKTLLIAGGAVVASLTTGAAGGYLFAKSKFTKEFDLRLKKELEETKKYYAIRAMEADKPDDITKVVTSDPSLEEETDYEPTDAEIAEAEEKATKGTKALTDYQAYGLKPDLNDVQVSNIFTDKRPAKHPMPPRDDKGKFVSPTAEDEKPEEDGPYSITPEDFLQNPFDYGQENLRYFAEEDTLLDYANEVVANELIGETNLKNFMAINPEAGDIFCVRNEGAEFDYEIQYVNESLTEYLGLAES